MTIYKSYDVVVGIRLGDLMLANQEKYSKTTTKHITQMLNEERGVIIKLIGSEELSRALIGYSLKFIKWHGELRRAVG